MFSWLSSLLASTAYDAAIYSAGLASHGGMCQIKEPDNLQQVVKEHKERKMKNNVISL